MSTLKVFLKWLGISIAVVVLAVVAINLFDESLDPKAAAYGEARPASVPDAENGYLLLLALDAPQGMDGTAYARAWLDEARAAAREKRPPVRPPREQVKRPELCEPIDRSCLALVRDDPAQVRKQLALFAGDLGRYDALVSTRRFEEVLDYPVGLHSDLPPYVALARAQRAYLLRVALDLEAGRPDQALAALERELAWQRLFLTESRVLVSKMVAARNYWRDLMFVRGLVEDRSARLAPHVPRLQGMLQPLDEAVRSLPKVAETEFAFVRGVYAGLKPDRDNLGDVVGWYFFGTALLYQPRATVNLAYHYHSELAERVLAAPAHRVAAESETFLDSWRDPPWWRYVYNPVGRILVSVSMPSWDEYPLRMHDLDALNRLMALRVELLAAGTKPAELARHVAASSPRLHDPYTRKPMAWDEERRRLYFVASSRRTRDLKYGVEGGRVFAGL
jgi:hypothetical protein